MERDPSAIRRPGGRAASHQRYLFGAVRFHYEQIRGVEWLAHGQQPVAVEDDPFSVRRQGWESISKVILRQTPRVCAVPVHQVDLGSEPGAHGIDCGIRRGVVARAHERDRRAHTRLLFAVAPGLRPRGKQGHANKNTNPH